MKTLKPIVAFIIRFRLVIITILAIAMGFSGYQTLNKLSVDNSLSIWFLEDDPSYKAYIDFQESFGSDEIFIAMLPVENAIGKHEVDALKALHNTIEALDYVETTFSLAKAKYPIYSNKSIRFDDLYNPKRSDKGLKSLFSKLPNITAQLVTADYKNQLFYIQMKPTPVIEKERQAIAAEINDIVGASYTDFYLTGPPVLNEAYSKGIYKESLTFGILTVLVITVLLLFLLPSRKYLLIALLSVAAPVSLLFGLITSLGFALNMISMLIPTILLVYSVSDAVHVINIYHKEGLSNNEELSKIDLIALAIRKSLTPCFYTTLTTFVGYFALYISPLPAFKNMGVFTCIGLVFSFILVYVITIIGFSYISLNFENTKPILQLKRISQTQFLNWLNVFTSRYKTALIVGFTALLLFGVYSVFQVEIDTNSRDLLAEGKAKNDLRAVETQLGGSNRLQVNITANNGTVLSKESIQQLEAFQAKLEENPLISNPVSIVSIKSFLEERTPVLFQSNVSEADVRSTLAKGDASDNRFFKLLSEDRSSAGVTMTLMEMRTSELEQVLGDIEQAFQATFETNNYSLKINGFAVVFAQLNNFILETQFKSFFAAFFVAFLCLWIFIKNLRTTLLVLIPNILPLAILAIFMSLLAIPLDVTTAMITPIMLGIAMDDTIHLVHKYRRSKYITGTPEERMDKAMHYTGGALFSTTIALVGGFLIIASSAVPSVRDFGLLCAVTVAIALITDIFYLPALLKRFDG